MNQCKSKEKAGAGKMVKQIKQLVLSEQTDVLNDDDFKKTKTIVSQNISSKQ